MAHHGTLRDYRFPDTDEAADDIRGSGLYGRDGEKLGKIDDVIFDHTSGAIRYIVVDTGGWLSSNKFIVPPDGLHSSAKHKDDFEVNLSQQQIEGFPPYKESDVESEEIWKNYEDRYKTAWRDGPVQHRKGSDHDVTPTPQEMPAEPGSIGSQLTPSQRAEVNSRITPAGADDVTIENSAMGIGARWLNFESRLRQRRRDITWNCASCTVGPASDRGAESAESERKAI